MNTPIVLWNDQTKEHCDDAGISIRKTVIQPPRPKRFPYESAAQHARRPATRGVPPLSYFCITSLIDVSEQLHVLGETRLQLREETGKKMLLRLLLPYWKTPHFSLLNIDPRLWAALIQIYTNIPSILSSYPMDLSDPYLPLLQQIPSTPDFTLITILDLQRSKRLTDYNIVVLKPLTNLCSLDISFTGVSDYAIKVLSRTLSFDDDGEPKGPWALRILRMRSCISVSKSVMSSLECFPLLCVIDLQHTRCTFGDIRTPFRIADNQDSLRRPMRDVLKALNDVHKSFLPVSELRILSVQEDLVREESSRPQVEKGTMRSIHNSFVVLPSSEGTVKSRAPLRIQFGNVDEVEESQRRGDVEERKRAFGSRRRIVEESEHENCSCRNCCWSMFNDASDEGLSDSLDEMSSDEEYWNHQEEQIANSSAAFNESTDVQIGMAFYKRMPQRSPTIIRSGEVEMILYRTPTPWTSLSSIQQGIRSRHEEQNAPCKKESTGTIQLQGKSGDKRAMQAWQNSLLKRRKTTVPCPGTSKVNPDDTFIPPPPKALCGSTSQSHVLKKPRFYNVSERPVIVPITQITRPKLKLEPNSVNIATPVAPERSNIQRKPPSLEAAFKSQRRIKEATEAKLGTSLNIKGPKQVVDESRKREIRGRLSRKSEHVVSSFDWTKWGLAR